MMYRCIEIPYPYRQRPASQGKLRLLCQALEQYPARDKDIRALWIRPKQFQFWEVENIITESSNLRTIWICSTDWKSFAASKAGQMVLELSDNAIPETYELACSVAEQHGSKLQSLHIDSDSRQLSLLDSNRF